MKSDQFFDIYQTLCREWEAFLLSNGIKLMTPSGDSDSFGMLLYFPSSRLFAE